MVGAESPDLHVRADESEHQITAAAVIASAGRGAFAGLVATLTMSAVMLPARWVGLLGTQPPRRISDRLIQITGSDRRVSEDQRRGGTSLVHLAIGAIGGAFFGLGRLASGGRGHAPAVGLMYGAALWGFNYIVAAPKLDLFPPPWDDRPGRPPVMLAANALYGVVTAVLFDRLQDRPRLAG